ncbi:MAG: hypothetical protein A2010_01040 [Nitrospirae bacterium GWD2_57_9]|nr:MAG: hypothetical protein A2010_01040 [Nitrospirae bacterium GWD2_57_9]OGW50806.1 MAG: hypothetical protein A2078_12460 [Nitrospirae bacterium GWC2_57_9]
MIRSLIFFIAIILVYYAVKTVIRSAFSAYTGERSRPRSLKGEEMILDPECRTYVIKERAVTRRIGRTVHSFCSEACADRYEKAHHGERG